MFIFGHDYLTVFDKRDFCHGQNVVDIQVVRGIEAIVDTGPMVVSSVVDGEHKIFAETEVVLTPVAERETIVEMELELETVIKLEAELDDDC